MKTKLCQLHFRGRSTLHKIGEFYLSDDGRQPQLILARSKAKIRNWKIINCFFLLLLFLVPKLSGPLLARLPLDETLLKKYISYN